MFYVLNLIIFIYPTTIFKAQNTYIYNIVDNGMKCILNNVICIILIKINFQSMFRYTKFTTRNIGLFIVVYIVVL